MKQVHLMHSSGNTYGWQYDFDDFDGFARITPLPPYVPGSEPWLDRFRAYANREHKRLSRRPTAAYRARMERYNAQRRERRRLAREAAQEQALTFGGPKLTWAQRQVLHLLARTDAPVRAAFVKHVARTATLRTLVKKGYVAISQEHTRHPHYQITDDGRFIESLTR